MSLSFIGRPFCVNHARIYSRRLIGRATPRAPNRSAAAVFSWRDNPSVRPSVRPSVDGAFSAALSILISHGRDSDSDRSDCSQLARLHLEPGHHPSIHPRSCEFGRVAPFPSLKINSLSKYLLPRRRRRRRNRRLRHPSEGVMRCERAGGAGEREREREGG